MMIFDFCRSNPGKAPSSALSVALSLGTAAALLAVFAALSCGAVLAFPSIGSAWSGGPSLSAAAFVAWILLATVVAPGFGFALTYRRLESAARTGSARG